jgi:hypothetical protein
MTTFHWAVFPVVLLAGMVVWVGPLLAEETAKPDPAATAQWAAKLREWRKWMTAEPVDPAKTIEAAREQIGQIDDPAALPAVLALLKTEKNGLFRRALIQPLIKLGGQDAVAALVKLSVEDENPTLRDEAAAGLAGKPELAQHLDQYVKYLHNPRHSSAAAKALRLSKLATRQSSAEPLDPKLTTALVAALVQKQKRLVPKWGVVDKGGRASSWSLHRGFSSRKILDVDVVLVEVAVLEPNPEVRETLKSYTSQDLEYDQSQWAKDLNLVSKIGVNQ